MTEENTETDPILEELFAAVVLAKDGSRKVSDMFTVLPSKTVSVTKTYSKKRSVPFTHKDV